MRRQWLNKREARSTTFHEKNEREEKKNNSNNNNKTHKIKRNKLNSHKYIAIENNM